MSKTKLNSNFSCIIDSTDGDKWNSIITEFRDATINQTMVYGQVRSNETSNLVLKRNGEVVAMVMLRLIVLPFFKAGIAYVSSGPIWRLRGEPDDIDVLRKTIQALKEEYVIQRGLLLRISPNIFTNFSRHDPVRSLFEEEGFRCKETDEMTLFLNLDQTLDEIRKGFHPKWRNCLCRAEKMNLAVYKGTDSELFLSFKGIYEEMLARKGYAATMDINQYEEIQDKLPESLKPIIILCELDGCPVAGAMVSQTGETAILMLAASSNEGRKCHASYLLQWEIIKYLKGLHFRTYDFGGCNPKINPDTHRFKARMLGKKPDLSSLVGVMEACSNLMSLFVVKFGEFLKSHLRRSR